MLLGDIQNPAHLKRKLGNNEYVCHERFNKTEEVMTLIECGHPIVQSGIDGNVNRMIEDYINKN